MPTNIYLIPRVEGNTHACHNVMILEGGIVMLYTQ